MTRVLWILLDLTGLILVPWLGWRWLPRIFDAENTMTPHPLNYIEVLRWFALFALAWGFCLVRFVEDAQPLISP